jgi:hypothetical protein
MQPAISRGQDGDVDAPERVLDQHLAAVHPATGDGPLGPSGFNFSQHMPTTRRSVERTAEKAFLLSDRV